MFNKLAAKLYVAKQRPFEALAELQNDENGDTNFVAIIVLIVIIVAIAGIFQSQLTGAVTNAFKKLTDFIG